MHTSKMTASLITGRAVSNPVSIMTNDFCGVLPSAGTIRLVLNAAMKSAMIALLFIDQSCAEKGNRFMAKV
jgi:hypothetical protein